MERQWLARMLLFAAPPSVLSFALFEVGPDRVSLARNSQPMGHSHSSRYTFGISYLVIGQCVNARHLGGIC